MIYERIKPIKGRRNKSLTQILSPAKSRQGYAKVRKARPFTNLAYFAKPERSFARNTYVGRLFIAEALNKNNTMRLLPALIFALLLINSCKSDDDRVTIEDEVALIDAYVRSNNLSTQVSNSGLYYEISGPQTGQTINPRALAVFELKQFLLDGTILVETSTTPAAAIPAQLFPGLVEGFSLLKKGDTGIFLMTSDLAFGSSGGNGVPPNTPVGFEITVVECHPDLLSYEISQIQNYILDNNLTAQATTSGLHYVIEEPGEGDHPTSTSRVSVNYKGFLLDGTVFDESNDAPLSIALTQVIAGWQEGIPLFKKGGKGLLFIPSSRAYGANGQGPIPPNTPIAFEIELVDFE